MSTAVDTSASTAPEASGSVKRRSLFKPSTWTKPSQPVTEPTTGTTAPVDAVETGAPLTALVEDSQPAPSSSGLTLQPDSLGRIVFFRQDQPNFFLSNSSPSYPVYHNSIRYPTAEHLFQALKFLPHRPDLANKVRRARHPLDAIRIARSHTSEYRAGWIPDGLNVVMMKMVLLAKFTQYESLARVLLETEGREVVNASPSDVFWGSGEEQGGRGRNELGKAIMEVREVVRRVNGFGYGSASKTM